jgi:hypothetical protein
MPFIFWSRYIAALEPLLGRHVSYGRPVLFPFLSLNIFKPSPIASSPLATVLYRKALSRKTEAAEHIGHATL